MKPETGAGGMDRRRFLKTAALGVAALGMGGLANPLKAEAGEISLSALPYPPNALEPFITGNTIKFHYGKHHAGYVKKLNGLIKGTPLEKLSLVEIIKQTAGKPDQAGVFNNAAQVWNHTFYWSSMAHGGGGAPKGDLAKKLEADFGGMDKFKEAFSKAATGQFGSGWAWLVVKDGKLEIMATANADTPLAHGIKPLLTCDVWEHAYYLDYQNRRGDYVKAWLDSLVNWDFAAQNLAS